VSVVEKQMTGELHWSTKDQDKQQRETDSHRGKTDSMLSNCKRERRVNERRCREYKKEGQLYSRREREREGGWEEGVGHHGGSYFLMEKILSQVLILILTN
jgi:hypothetical protein